MSPEYRASCWVGSRQGCWRTETKLRAAACVLSGDTAWGMADKPWMDVALVPLTLGHTWRVHQGKRWIPGDTVSRAHSAP